MERLVRTIRSVKWNVWVNGKGNIKATNTQTRWLMYLLYANLYETKSTQQNQLQFPLAPN